MNKKAMMGLGGGVIAIVAAVVIYLVAFSGGGSGPSGGATSASGQARAEKLFAGVTSSQQFKAGGGKVVWKSAEAQGDQGVQIKNVEITGKDKQGKDRKISVDEITVRKLDWNQIQGSPYADVEIKGLRSPQFAETPQFKQFMEATGLKDLVIDIKVRYQYNKDSKLMDVQEAVVTARELGTFTLRAQIHGLDIAAVQKMQEGGKFDPAQLMGMAAAIQIGKIYISFKDQGAIDKSATMQAKKMGGDKDKVIEMAVQQLEQQKAAIPFDIAKKAADAAIKFLKNKSTIIAKADPASPVPVIQIAMMGQPTPAKIESLVKSLGISIMAE